MTSLADFMKSHIATPGVGFTHTRIGDKMLNVYGGVYNIPDEDYPEFWKLYSQHIQSGKLEFLTEKQYSDGPLVVDLDFRYDADTEERKHTEEDIENIVSIYAEHLAEMVSGPMPTYDIYVSHKSTVNRQDDVTKDGIHLFFSVRVPRIIQKALRAVMLELLPQSLEHLPLINKWTDVLDEGITNGGTNWQLIGSRKPGNSAYEITHAFRVNGEEILPIDVGSIDKSKISVRCKKFPMVSANTSNENIMTLMSRKTTPSSSMSPKQRDRLSVGTSPSDVSAFIASIPDEKAGPFQTWASYVCMLIRKYRDTKTDAEMRNIIHEFSRKAADCYDEAKVDEWLEKYDDTKFPEDMRFPEASSITQEVRDASRQVLAQEVATTPKTEYGESDEDFATIAFNRLKNQYVYSQGQLFYKNGNIWSNDTRSYSSSLRSSIIALKMKRRFIKEVKGGTVITEINYCDMMKNVKNVASRVEDKIIENPDPEFYQKLHSTTLGKLCFNDGVYDFRRRAFYEWNSEELKKNPVYSLTKIHRNFPKAVDSAFKKECYDKVFLASLGEENTKRWIPFLSRAVAGELQDKLFGTIITNRDCSKGVTNDWLMAAFGDYVRQTDSKNFLVQRERSGGDAAKENGWLVDFQTVRLMLISEFPIDMKNKGMKINSTLIKSINSGGDKIEGRKNFKDSMTFNIQSTTIFMVNDLPAFTANDVLEKCIEITTTVQFKTQAYIDEQLKAAAGNEDLIAYRTKNLKIADENLRGDVKSDKYADALVHIIIDNYQDKSIQVIRDNLVDGDQDIKLDETIFTTYKITGNPKHFTSNEELKEFAIECDCSLKKLKSQIKGMGNVTDGWGGSNNKQKGIRGIISRSVFETEELKVKQIESLAFIKRWVIASIQRHAYKRLLEKKHNDMKRLEEQNASHAKLFNRVIKVAQ